MLGGLRHNLTKVQVASASLVPRALEEKGVDSRSVGCASLDRHSIDFTCLDQAGAEYRHAAFAVGDDL